MSTLLREFQNGLADRKAVTRIEPCLPTLAHNPPLGAGWLHEIKHDGFRMMIRRDAASPRVITRNGHDWSRRFPLMMEAAETLSATEYVIDGEAVVCDANGLAIFDKIRYRRHDGSVFLFAFDLLSLNGRDLRREPIERRKAALTKLLRTKHPGIRLVEHINDEDGDLIFKHACELGCEGIVSKRLGSTYRSGRSQDWIKVKNPRAPAAQRLEEQDWNGRRR
jgi:bifunctional non-homologous end joining protein LigD